MHQPNARNHASSGRNAAIHPMRRQRPNFQKRRPRIQQPRHAVPRQHLAAPEVARAAPTVVEAAEGLSLALVRPNPTRDRAEITFSVEAPTTATVRVFDVTGRQVALLYDRPTPADALQTVAFDATAVAPGTYVAVLEADGRRTTQTFQVIR